MKILYYYLLCWLLIEAVANNTTKKWIYFGAIIPDMDFDRFNFRAAMEVAEELINKDDGILKDYKLKIQYIESHESAFILKDFLTFLKGPHINQVILGASHSDVTQFIVPLTNVFNVPQISYTSKERFNTLKTVDGVPLQFEKLEDKPFPLYTRMMPTVEYSNEARIQLIQKFNWKRVAIIMDDQSEFIFHFANDFKSQLRKANIEVTTTEYIEDKNYGRGKEEEINVQMDRLIETNSKVIFLFTTANSAGSIFCQAFKRGMFSPEYTWVSSEIVGQRFYKAEHFSKCTVQDFLKVLNGVINFAIMDIRKDSKPIIANKTGREIAQGIQDQYKKNLEIYKKNNPKNRRIVRKFYRQSTYAVDTVLTAARALDNIIKEQGEDGLIKDFTNRTKALKFTETVFKSNFDGVTGHVYYGKEAGDDERMVPTKILQWYSDKNLSTGEYKEIGVYDRMNNKSFIVYEAYNDSIFNDGAVRKDGTIIQNKIRTFIPKSQLIVLWTLTALGAILSIIFFSINVKYRQIRLIKMSSPNVNNGIVLGSLLCYLCIVINGLDTRFITRKGMEITCNILPASLSIGFTFTFGCLFSKTWRVYKIFSAARTMEKVNTAALKDIRLYIIVFCLIAIDVVISVAWVLISPFRLEEVVAETRMVRDDLMDVFYYEKCKCDYELHFNVAMYCYKGFLLVSGLFLAWETRNIKVAALNDSQYIGMAVYNVFVVTVIGVTCFYSLTDTSNYLQHGYLIFAFSIFMCTVTTVIMVFTPKIHLLFGKSINKSVERAMSVQTFSFAASVIRRSQREKKVVPAESEISSHRYVSSVSSSKSF